MRNLQLSSTEWHKLHTQPCNEEGDMNEVGRRSVNATEMFCRKSNVKKERAKQHEKA